MATRQKISKVLNSLTQKTRNFAPGSGSNGVLGKLRVDPFMGFGRAFSSSAIPLESDLMGPRILGLKDYEDYRRALYGGMTHKALLVDAVGTLVVPSQPMAQAPLFSLSLSLSLSPELVYLSGVFCLSH